MESNRSTKKRKQRSVFSSSVPFVRRFTRSSLSQIHRSDRVFSDSISEDKQRDQSGCLGSSEAVKRTRISILGAGGGDGDVDGLMNRTAVVDLRSRRIFSPASVTVTEDYDDDDAVVKSFENNELRLGDSSPVACSNSRDLKTVDEIKVIPESLNRSDGTIVDNPNSCDGNSERDETPNSDGAISERIGVDSGEKETKPLIPNSCDGNSERDETPNSDGAFSERIGVDSGEERVQTTSTDSDVNLKVEASHVPEKPSGTGGADGGGVTNCTTRSKLDRLPSASLKLFKTPSSFGYRRLLPYLTSIAKDNSFASSNDQFPKPESDLKLTSPVQVLESHSQEMSVGKSALHSPLSKPCSAVGAALPDVTTRAECTAEKSNGKLDVSDIIDELDAACGDTSSLGLLEPLQRKLVNHIPENAEKDNKISASVSLDGGQSIIEASIYSGLSDIVSLEDVNDKMAISNGVDEDSSEECVLTTPPDSNIFEANLTYHEEKPERAVVTASTAIGPTPVSVNQLNTSILRNNNVVMKPCYRKRIFKTPNSYSYRRLLPYLKEIAKDDSLEPISCQTQTPSDLEEITTVTMPISTSFDNSREHDNPCNVGCGSPASVMSSLDSLNPTDGDSLENGLFDLKPKTSELHDSSVKPRNDKRDVDSVSADLDRPDGGSSSLDSLNPTDRDSLDMGSLDLQPSTSELDDSSAKDMDDKRGVDSVGVELDPLDVDSGVQCVQLTPTVEAEVKVNRGTREEHIHVIPSSGGSRGSVSETVAAKKNQISSPAKSEVERKLWSGKSVYKGPNSFGYRRLLPFLKEITKDDDSFESRNHQPVKLASDLKENPSIQEVSIGKDTPRSTLSSAVSNINGLTAAAPNHTTGECLSKPGLCINPHEPKVVHDNASSVQRSDPSITTLCSPEGVRKDSKISRLNNTTTDRTVFGQSLPQFGIQSSFKSLNGGPMKGILKSCSSLRRGCRGICTCVKCASFRLNAERAFEFSRTQLFEAEEVASDLMKELSCIRALLENVTAANTDHGVLHINQVEEACLRASKAEEVAKARLDEMNHDLNCHSRMKDLQRPRVRFANDVAEKS